MYSSCGILCIRPVRPMRAICWSIRQKKASAGAQLMRFQLARAAKERGGEAANGHSRSDLGASKYPPWAERARVRTSASPLLLSLSWATGGNNSGERSRQHESQCHCIDTLLGSTGYTQHTETEEEIKHLLVKCCWPLVACFHCTNYTVFVLNVWILKYVFGGAGRYVYNLQLNVSAHFVGTYTQFT